jgi:hypothetical protein
MGPHQTAKHSGVTTDGNRHNMNTATKPELTLTLPGRRGTTDGPDSLSALVNELGIPTTAGRRPATRPVVA